MLHLVFRLGHDRYALPAADVAEVLPLFACKLIPGTPPWVAGLFSYSGMPVPVIDLSQLALGRPARRSLSTRTVLVHYPAPGPDSRLLGLLVEQATSTLWRAAREFADAGILNQGAPYLGPVAGDGAGLVQVIRIRDLLPAEVRALLFPASEAV